MDDSPRTEMFADLKRRVLKLGMSEEKVVDLLGEPDARSQGELDYYLGIGSDWLGCDGDIMRLRFDNKGRLVEVDWYQS